MGIISWLVVGAIAGWIAGMIVPGDEGYGVIGTIIAGIAGAFVGGVLIMLITGQDFNDVISGFDIGTIIAAIVGAVIVVFAWKSLSGRRTA
jgi:uncharacterized membrane protein YeaQ/YmgE (transglycosylase-associated protein family)